MSMTKIAEVNLGTAAASIDFTSIPQTYTDLYILVSNRNSNAANDNSWLVAQFNGDTGSNYQTKRLYGSGSGTGSSDLSTTFVRCSWSPGNGRTANTFANNSIYIPNYAGSTAKSVSADGVEENNASTAFQSIEAGRWSGTAAITSIKLFCNDGYNFVAGSTATLYGISKVPAAGSQAKATGGDIYQNGTYTYHVFNSSGTFTPTAAITNADVLVVAGGGGGGGYYSGGGGGAGGLLSFTGQSLVSGTPLTVTVGAGGAAATSSPSSSAAQGVSSQFGSFTATIGGGRGGNGGTAPGQALRDAGSGGSGGGGGGDTSPGAAGSATSGQGNAGGAGANGTYGYKGGGGGGAGTVGASGATGTGGDGVSTYSAWLLATSYGVSGYIAGGGGGGAQDTSYGAGGAGGAGSGGYSGGGTRSATAAVANTGSGGGGSGSGNAPGGNGGSGIVIIRYA